MPIKNFKPNTPGTRGMSTLINEEITASTPEKSLLVKKSKTGGRNNQGKITVRHIGGGVRQKYRLIDFKRNKEISREIKMVLKEKLHQSNMIQIEVQILH